MAKQEELSIVVRLQDFASKQLRTLRKDVLEFGKVAIKGLAVGGLGAGAAGAAGLFAIIKSTANAADNLGDLSRQLGVSVEALGALQFAAKQSGVSVEEVEVAIKTLNKGFGELNATGGGPAADGFNKLSAGLRQMVKAGAPTEEIFLQITRELKNLNQADRALAASNLFGKGGSRLLRLATEDVDGLMRRFRELGGTIDQDLVKKSDAFNDSLGELGVAAGALGKDISRALLPELTKLAKLLTQELVDHRPEVLEFFASVTEGAGATGKAILGIIGPLLQLDRNFASIRLDEAGKRVLAITEGLKMLRLELSHPTPGAFDVSEAVRAAIPKEIELKTQQLEAAQGVFEQAKKSFESISNIDVTGDAFADSMNGAAKSLRDQAESLRAMKYFMGPLQESDQERASNLEAQAEALENVFGSQRKVTEEARRSAQAAAKMGKEIEKYANDTDFFSGLNASFQQAGKEAQEFGKIAQRAVAAITDSIADNLTDSLVALIDGTKSAKEAFRDFALAVLKDIQRLIIKETILLVIKSTLGAIGGAKDGGVFQGSFQPVSGHLGGGGVVNKRGLFELREGGRNEAVVPLPNNRDIPVQITHKGKQPAGDVYFQIAVHYASGATTTAGEAQLMDRNAKQIAGIIARELRQDAGFREAMRPAA